MTEQIKDVRDVWAIFLKRKKFFVIPFVDPVYLGNCDLLFIARRL